MPKIKFQIADPLSSGETSAEIGTDALENAVARGFIESSGFEPIHVAGAGVSSVAPAPATGATPTAVGSVNTFGIRLRISTSDARAQEGVIAAARALAARVASGSASVLGAEISGVRAR